MQVWHRDDGKVVCREPGSDCGVVRKPRLPERLTQNHDARLREFTEKFNALIDEYSTHEDGRQLSVIRVDDGFVFAWCSHEDATDTEDARTSNLMSYAKDPVAFHRALGLD